MSNQKIVFGDEFFNELHNFTQGDNDEQQRIINYIKERYESGDIQPNVEYIFSPDTREFLEVPDEMFESQYYIEDDIANRVYH